MDKELDLEKVHLMLNNLYERAQELRDELMSRGFKCRIVDAKGNYLLLSGSYVRQQYAIPVVEVEEKGDIGFNLDGPFFEFSLSREQLTRIDLKSLRRRFRVEIFEGDSAMTDFYSDGDSLQNVLNRTALSEASAIMLALYVDPTTENLLVDFLFGLKAIKRL